MSRSWRGNDHPVTLVAAMEEGSVDRFTAVYAAAADPDDPLRALRQGELEPPRIPDSWVRVRVRASSLNHHDLWSLRGVGLPAERLPMILGTDAAGVDEAGNEVIVYGVIDDGASDGDADPLLSERRSMLSELYPGTLASWVSVPRQNLVPKPPSVAFEQAAVLPTAWLTAYRMLVSRGGLRSGDSVLVQGAGGGVAVAVVYLAVLHLLARDMLPALREMAFPRRAPESTPV